MHASVIGYLKDIVKPDEVLDKEVLEIGSYDVNGSPRLVFDPLKPKKYLGIDQSAGPGVDVVINANKMVDVLGSGRFDIVLSTEMLEHALEWKIAVNGMKEVLKEEGIIFLTTRGPGFKYHPFPDDFWRFTVDDFKKIFADMEILDLRPDPDPESPGVFLKARKPKGFLQTDLSGIEVSSAPRPL